MTEPGPNPSKPIWTRWWMIAIYVVAGLGIVGAVLSPDDDGGDETDTTDPGSTTEPTGTTEAAAEV